MIAHIHGAGIIDVIRPRSAAVETEVGCRVAAGVQAWAIGPLPGGDLAQVVLAKRAGNEERVALSVGAVVVFPAKSGDTLYLDGQTYIAIPERYVLLCVSEAEEEETIMHEEIN